MESAWVKLEKPLKELNRLGKETKTVFKKGKYRILRRQNGKIEIYSYLGNREYYPIVGYIIGFLRAVGKEFELDIEFLNKKYNTRHLGFLVIKELNKKNDIADRKEDFNPLAIISRDVFDHLLNYREKDKNLCFRIINDKKSSTFLPFKIKNGKIIITFWAGNNYKNGMPNIYLSINGIGEVSLILEEDID
ncbi:MAG: hypothetical protein ACPGXZ_17665, partial [Saprospiraceae bacterium]